MLFYFFNADIISKNTNVLLRYFSKSTRSNIWFTIFITLLMCITIAKETSNSYNKFIEKDLILENLNKELQENNKKLANLLRAIENAPPLISWKT